MDKYLFYKENIKNISRFEDFNGYSLNDHANIDIDRLDRLFDDVEDYFNQLYNLLIYIEKEFRDLSILSCMKAKKDFEKFTGLPIDEMQNLVLKINRIWREIKRAILFSNLDKLDLVLRTYAYHRNFFNQKLSSCAKYNQVVKSLKYIKYRKKANKIVDFTNELEIVADNFAEYLEQLYGLLLLSD